MFIPISVIMFILIGTIILEAFKTDFEDYSTGDYDNSEGNW